MQTASRLQNIDSQRSFLVTSHVPNVAGAPQQVKCHGTGNFLKLLIKEKPGRSQFNPYSQVSISSIKVWGRVTGYTGTANRFIENSKDKTRLNKVLLEMGVAAEVLNWYDETDTDYANMPIDENTKVTLKDMDGLAQRFLDKEDFEAMKKITTDLKKVVKLGREIFGLQSELEFAIAQQNYKKAIELKEKIQRLERERDIFDARYETSRYERMILLQNNSTMLPENDDGDLSNTLNNSLPPTIQQSLVKPEPEPYDYNQDPRNHQKPPKVVTFNDHLNVRTFNNHDAAKEKENKLKNQGDRDLESYFRPKFIHSQGVLSELPPDILNRLTTLGLLDVFGYDLWRAYYSENWRLRLAAAQAVLDFIKMPLIARYIGKTKSLFLACTEICRLISEDKVLEIYLCGLKIQKVALKPPVCGDDIPVAIVNKVLAEFSTILIKKIGEFNTKARDISLATLMEIFSHHPSKLAILVDACMDICEKEKDFILYGKAQTIPIEKQQPRLVISRLEIIRYCLENFGYKQPPAWSFREPFDLLLVPALFHPNNEVRSHAVELALGMFLGIGEEIRQLIFSIDGLKPGIYEELNARMDILENDALGRSARAKPDLEEIVEADEEEKKDDEAAEPAASKSGKTAGSKPSKDKKKSDKGSKDKSKSAIEENQEEAGEEAEEEGKSEKSKSKKTPTGNEESNVDMTEEKSQKSKTSKKSKGKVNSTTK